MREMRIKIDRVTTAQTNLKNMTSSWGALRGNVSQLQRRSLLGPSICSECPGKSLKEFSVTEGKGSRGPPLGRVSSPNPHFLQFPSNLDAGVACADMRNSTLSRARLYSAQKSTVGTSIFRWNVGFLHCKLGHIHGLEGEVKCPHVLLAGQYPLQSDTYTKIWTVRLLCGM